MVLHQFIRLFFGFGVPIAISFTRFFNVRKATSNHDSFTLYAFCILRGQFRLNIHDEAHDTAYVYAAASLRRHCTAGNIAVRFPFYARKATSNHDPFTLYVFCILRGEPKHRAEYIKAVSKELTGLLRLGTFAICREDECDDLKPLGSKSVFNIKYLADGSLDKYKERIVALGYMARAGIDFYSTWSPMASLTSIRLICSIAVH